MSRNAGRASGAGVGLIQIAHWPLLEIKIDAPAATKSSHAPSRVSGKGQLRGLRVR